MKKLAIFISFLILAGYGFAQSEGVSPKKSFNIVKEVKPPILAIVDNNIEFVDPSGNNAIDANETCKIKFRLKNSGYGDGYNLKAKISATGSTSGLTFSNKDLPVVKIAETITVELPIYANMNTADGTANFVISIDEPNGFGVAAKELSVATLKFQAPLLQIVDYTVTGAGVSGTLEKIKPFDLQLLLQNTAHGTAENVTVSLKHPDGIFILGRPSNESFAKMDAGEQQSLVYTLIVNNDYSSQDIPIEVIVAEKHNRFAENKTIRLSLNQALANTKIDIKPVIASNKPNIVIGSLRSDVDKNIPTNSSKNPNRFALIIGNEDYSSYQRGLQTESNVAFATSDASVFKEYCTQTLGVPSDNVVLLTDATAARMSQEIEKMAKLVALKGSAGELIFYYAGHGFPDEATKEPYLIPVDVSAASLKSGIKLYDLYERLSEIGAGRITIFMDACFSGGGRESGLLAARSVKIHPKKGELKGNIVVFAATQEDQFALPYTEKQHGMFTYFLLKQLQTNAQCSYSELDKYLKDNVSEQSLRKNGKDQIPETQVSNSVMGIWESWKF